MNTHRIAIIAALAWAALLSGICRADTAASSLAILCGPRASILAPYVREASMRYLEHPVTIVALIAAESRCRTDAIGARGERGLTQVTPGGDAANGMTPEQLMDPRTSILVGIRWLSLCAVRCGGLARGLGKYNGGKCWRSHAYSARVLALVARFWAAMASREARTS